MFNLNLRSGNSKQNKMQKRILRIGSLSLKNTNVKSICAIGEARLDNCVIKSLRSIGSLRAKDCEFEYIYSIGEIDIKGVTKAKKVIIVGDALFESLECTILRSGLKKFYKINGNPEIRGFVKAETYEHCFALKIKAEFEFNNIISKVPLAMQRELQCVNFYSFTQINVPEVNADFIYIKTYDNSQIGALTGETIVASAKYIPDRKFKSIPKSVPLRFYKKIYSAPGDIMKIGSIEADNIYIDNVHADYVSGRNIVVGDLCIIERLEYIDSVKISKKALVNDVKKIT